MGCRQLKSMNRLKRKERREAYEKLRNIKKFNMPKEYRFQFNIKYMSGDWIKSWASFQRLIINNTKKV